MTVTAIPTSVWMAPDSVCTASGTQQGSTVKGVWMAILETPSEAHPDSASRAPVPYLTWPTLQNPASGKTELFGVCVKKTMLGLTVKDVLLVTMETPYSSEAPVRNVTAVAIRIPTSSLKTVMKSLASAGTAYEIPPGSSVNAVLLAITGMPGSPRTVQCATVGAAHVTA